MGCDIHLFIEYRNSKKARQWDSLSFRDLILRRNYRTFAAMDGVRQCDDFKVDFQPPRGLPKDHSFHAGMANQLYVVDRRDHIGDDEASKFDVEKWISQGLSRWIDEDYVTHPDWHSHSWLSPDEYQRALEASENQLPDYRAVLGALRALEQSGCEARVVFWFDN